VQLPGTISNSTFQALRVRGLAVGDADDVERLHLASGAAVERYVLGQQGLEPLPGWGGARRLRALEERDQLLRLGDVGAVVRGVEEADVHAVRAMLGVDRDEGFQSVEGLGPVWAAHAPAVVNQEDGVEARESSVGVAGPGITAAGGMLVAIGAFWGQDGGDSAGCGLRWKRILLGHLQREKKRGILGCDDVGMLGVKRSRSIEGGDMVGVYVVLLATLGALFKPEQDHRFTMMCHSRFSSEWH
jgi:hypothetical protein